MSSNGNDALSLFDGQIPSKDKHYEFGFALPAPTPSAVQPMDVDTSAGSLQLFQSPIKQEQPPATIAELPGEKRQRLNDGQVKRKIRKLATEDDGHQRSGGGIVGEKRFYQLVGVRLLVVCSMAVLMAFGVGLLTDDNVRKDFYKRYKRQYELLLYGVEDYCSQQLDFSNVSRALESQLVGQGDAIEHVSRTFYENRHQLYSSMALVGPVGVGKSLMANVIAENFQWRPNVHRFSLAISPKQYSRFQQFLQSIRSAPLEPKCGHNLLIIDAIDAEDVAMVNRMDQRMASVANKDGIQVTAIFVFQGTSFGSATDLGVLNGTIERIVLRQLDVGDLEGCVRLEAAGLGYNVEDNPRLLRTVMASVDVERYGCKAVLAKLGYYWQQQSSQTAENLSEM